VFGGEMMNIYTWWEWLEVLILRDVIEVGIEQN
jgi:hypothetical protein